MPRGKAANQDKNELNDKEPGLTYVQRALAPIAKVAEYITRKHLREKTAPSADAGQNFVSMTDPRYYNDSAVDLHSDDDGLEIEEEREASEPDDLPQIIRETKEMIDSSEERSSGQLATELATKIYDRATHNVINVQAPGSVRKILLRLKTYAQDKPHY